MELLGFQITLAVDTSPIRVGKGIARNGFIKDSVCGVGCRELWRLGQPTKAVQKAQHLITDLKGQHPITDLSSSTEGLNNIIDAIHQLKEAKKYRKHNMAKLFAKITRHFQKYLQKIKLHGKNP
jgi:hypothetical protein